MSRPLRIRAFNRAVPAERGYVGETHERVQQLQIRVGWAWHVVDEEIVPEAVLIEIGALGWSSWRSKFAGIGSWGRDGTVHLGDDGKVRFA